MFRINILVGSSVGGSSIVCFGFDIQSCHFKYFSAIFIGSIYLCTIYDEGSDIFKSLSVVADVLDLLIFFHIMREDEMRSRFRSRRTCTNKQELINSSLHVFI